MQEGAPSSRSQGVVSKLTLQLHLQRPVRGSVRPQLLGRGMPEPGQAGPPELMVCVSPSSASETSRWELGIRQGGNIHATEIGKWFKVGLSSPQPLELVVKHFPAQSWSPHSCASRLGSMRAWVCVSHACMLPSFTLTTTPSYRHCLHFTDGENRCREFRELPRVPC